MTNTKTSAIRPFDPETSREDGGSPALPLALLMRQLAGVIEGLSDAQYAQNPVGVVESSIGAHVRHCLDHVVALLGAVETGALDYDSRQRGTAIETSRLAALRLIADVERQVARITPDDPDRPVLLSVTLAAGQEAVRVFSSVGRELAYVVSHTIHHNALLNAMVRTLGGSLPERFGYAPGTVAYMESQARCARSA
jgi:uncharacterized damage-inducible protein DinB